MNNPVKSRENLITISLFVACLAMFGFSNSDFETPKRIRYSINETEWKFKRDEVKNGFKPSLNDADWLNIKIPHDYNGGSDGVHNDVFQGRFDTKNDADKRMMYKGPGWYRTKINIDEKYKGKRVFQQFGD
jgi:beta-galactosidase